MATFKERIDRHDREIAAIRKLIHAGMKMLVKFDQNLLRLEGDQMILRQQQTTFQEQQIALREEQIASRKELRELRASQRETDRQLQAFIRSMRRTGNGRVHGGIDA
jgi:septation ring formation regulator EzrA